ncbi:MAG: DUF350 domain-containing protein [Planctomycetes bacterium]|nr:DUF350 domain-containing protein [Planctomycetota bacterium]
MIHINPFDLIELAIALVFIFIAKILQDVITKFDDDQELFTADNPALGIAKANYYLAILISFRGLFMGEGLNGWLAIRDFCAYAALSLVLINLSVIITDKLILNRFKVYELICKDRNEGVAWALSGCYIGSACILSGAISGDDIPLLDSFLEIGVYYMLGQVILVASSKLYRVSNRDLHSALADNNTSAGLSFAGFQAALGLILGSQAAGNMTLMKEDLFYFVCLSALAIVILLLARRFIFRFIFASGISLRKEVSEDKNRAAGWIYALGSIGFALLLIEAL